MIMVTRKTSLRQQKMAHTLPRRDCLKAMGLLLLGSQAIGAPAVDWKAKAKKNLKLGVLSQVYAGLPLEEAAKRIRADGFTGVVTDYAFADVRFDPLAPDWDMAKKITGAFDRLGVKIVGIAGYHNVVEPDAAKRRRGEARMEAFIVNWKRLGCPNISTETGTRNPESEWLISPENATEEAYVLCRAAMEKLARLAEKTGAVVSIEPYWQNVIDSIDRAERLFREVNSPSLRLVMDPCNFFRKEDLPRMQPMLEEMFKRLGDQIVLAHAKDVKASVDGTDLPAAGKGVLDYPLYLRLLAQLDREVYLSVEHVGLADVARARDYVLSQFERI
jgi:sugar phosphate isomerase/epimerase